MKTKSFLHNHGVGDKRIRAIEEYLSALDKKVDTATEVIEKDTTSLADMKYGKMYLDEENDAIFVPINEPGTSAYKVLEFTEDGLFLNEKVGNANQRTKLSPRLADLTPEERATLKGDKGDQGDSAVYDPSSPDAPDFVMANTTGQSTTKAMTQKAVTDEFEKTKAFSYTAISLDSITAITNVASGNKWVLGNNTERAKFLPVTPGQVYMFNKKNGNNYHVFFTTDTSHTANETPHYAGGITTMPEWITGDSDVYMTAPNDAAYLYVRTLNNNVDRTPNIYLVTSIKDAVTEALEMKERVDGVIEEVDGSQTPLTIPELEMGYIDTSGSEGSSTSVFRTSTHIPVSESSIIVRGFLEPVKNIISTAKMLYLNVHCYNNVKSSLGRTTLGYQLVSGGHVEFPLKANTSYIKLTMELADDGGQSITADSYITALNSARNDMLNITLSGDIGIANKVDELAGKFAEDNFLALSDYESGSFDSSGTPITSTSVRSINYMEVDGDRLFVKCYPPAFWDGCDNVGVSGACWDESYNFLGLFEEGYQATINGAWYKLLAGTKYIKFVLGLKKGSDVFPFSTAKSAVFNATKQEWLHVKVVHGTYYVSGTYSTIENAVTAVPSDKRRVGMVVGFSDGIRWRKYKFAGDCIADFENGCWIPATFDGEPVEALNADKQTMISSLCRVNIPGSSFKVNKYFAFAHITDTHAVNKEVMRAVEYLNSNPDIDCLVHTGDIQRKSFNDVKAVNVERFGYFQSAVSEAQKPFFFALGNHDLNGASGSAVTLKKIYDRYMSPMVEKGWLTSDNIDSENYATWYFKDFAEYGIRLIALNNFDPLYDGYYTSKGMDDNYTKYSQDQIDFLVETLNSVPENYHVVIAVHNPYNSKSIATITNNGWSSTAKINNGVHGSAQPIIMSADPMMDVLKAYTEKGTLAKTYTYTEQAVQTALGSVEVDADFTSAEGKIAFIAFGHNHDDWIGKFESYGNIIGVCMAGSILAEPDSDLGRGMMGGSGEWQAPIPELESKMCGKSQDAINVYIVRTDISRVYVIRVGADFTTDLKERKLTYFDY